MRGIRMQMREIKIQMRGINLYRMIEHQSEALTTADMSMHSGVSRDCTARHMDLTS